MPAEAAVSLEELMKRATSGDPAAPAEIGSYLKTNSEAFAKVGDLAAHAEDKLVTIISDGDEQAANCLRQKLGRLKAELDCDSKSPTLRLAANRVVMDWLYLHFLDLLCCETRTESEGKQNAILLRKVKAHKLYLASLKLYELMRRAVTRADRDSQKGHPAGNKQNHAGRRRGQPADRPGRRSTRISSAPCWLNWHPPSLAPAVCTALGR